MSHSRLLGHFFWDIKQFFFKYLWVLIAFSACFVLGGLLGFVFSSNETLCTLSGNSVDWFLGLVVERGFFGQFFQFLWLFVRFAVLIYLLSCFPALFPVACIILAIRGFVFAIALVNIFTWSFFLALVYTLFLLIFLQGTFVLICFFAACIGIEERKCGSRFSFLSQDGLMQLLFLLVFCVAAALVLAILSAIFLNGLFRL